MSGAMQPVPQAMPQPDPAMVQWQQSVQQAQAVMASNRQKQQEFDAAVAVMKADNLHGFKLDIEADSTVEADQEAEKASRVEFVSQFVPLMEKVGPMAMGNPAMAELAKEIVLFAVRAFPAARTLEGSIEKGFEAIGKMPAPPPPGQKAGPDPQIENAKVQADMHDTNVKAQTEMASIAQKEQQSNAEMEIERMRLAGEQGKAQADMALKAAQLQQHERMQNVRAEHLAASSARGLV